MADSSDEYIANNDEIYDDDDDEELANDVDSDSFLDLDDDASSASEGSMYSPPKNNRKKKKILTKKKKALSSNGSAETSAMPRGWISLNKFGRAKRAEQRPPVVVNLADDDDDSAGFGFGQFASNNKSALGSHAAVAVTERNLSKTTRSTMTTARKATPLSPDNDSPVIIRVSKSKPTSLLESPISVDANSNVIDLITPPPGHRLRQLPPPPLRTEISTPPRRAPKRMLVKKSYTNTVDDINDNDDDDDDDDDDDLDAIAERREASGADLVDLLEAGAERRTAALKAAAKKAATATTVTLIDDDDDDDIVLTAAASSSPPLAAAAAAESKAVAAAERAALEEQERIDEEEQAMEEVEDLIRKCETYAATLRSATMRSGGGSSSAQSPSAGHRVIGQPACVPVRLRDYQLVGLNWLYLLRSNKMNGILADEMGLGKTAQTVTFLAYLMQENIDRGPHLIISPSSTLENWSREFNRFAPNMTPLIYHGTQTDRRILQSEIRSDEIEFDVMITSYNMAQQKTDLKFLKNRRFSYIVLDEAQALKNSTSTRYKSLQKVARTCKRRIMLTGTPLQNNLPELWALLNFLMPHFFDSNATEHLDLKKQLKSARSVERREQLEKEYVERTKKILQPFILRRLKDDVTNELNPKTTFVVPCVMTEAQQIMYREALQQSQRMWAQHEQKLSSADDENVSTTTTTSAATTATVGGSGSELLVTGKRARPAAGAFALLEEDEDDNGDDDSAFYQIAGSPMRRLKRPVADDGGDAVLMEPAVKKKGSGKNAHQQGADGPSAKQSTNIIMQLRKIANCPLLCRSLYTEDLITKIGQTLIDVDPEFRDYPLAHMLEDLRINSDFELHRVCYSVPQLHDLCLTEDQICSSSGKLPEMLKLLTKFTSEGLKCLIFSQMTRMLDIIELFMNRHGFRFVRLDGQIPVAERQQLIDSFQTDPAIVAFLLSTRAGGLGINLTAASRVVFYDNSFNPTADRQAEDRCHRMGQERDVEVYKLASANTIDQSILEMQESKNRINDRILEEGAYTDGASGSTDIKVNSKVLLSLVSRHLKEQLGT